MERKELIQLLKVARSVDVSKRITIKVLDYSGNPVSPVKTAYRVFYTDIAGCKRKSVYYGADFGFQG